MDAAGLERLPKNLEYAAVPLRQLVEEEHAVMSERNLAGARVAAAAHERDRRSRVVRRAQRTSTPILETEAPDERVHCSRFERFFFGHRREQPGKPLGKHGFPRARR